MLWRKNFKPTIIKTVAGEGKGANMGETDREKVIESQGGGGNRHEMNNC